MEKVVQERRDEMTESYFAERDAKESDVSKSISSVQLDLNSELPSNIGINDDMDALYRILDELDLSDLKAVACVCRLWNDISNSEYTWGRIMRQVCGTSNRTFGPGKITPSRNAFNSTYLHFKPSRPNSGIIVSNNGRTIRSDNTVKCWQTITLECPAMHDGIHLFKLRFDGIKKQRPTEKRNFWEILVGLTVTDAPPLKDGEWLGHDNSSMGYATGRGAFVECESGTIKYTCDKGKIHQGYTISLAINMARKRVSYTINAPMCQAFHWGKNGDKHSHWNMLSLAIGLSRPGQIVTLVEHKYAPCGRPKPGNIRPPRTPIVDVAPYWTATKDMEPLVPFPPPVVE
jgi:hypothetical protein